MATRSMGSPVSSLRSCRFRWLYRKQYLTPTIILSYRQNFSSLTKKSKDSGNSEGTREKKHTIDW